MRSSRVTSPFRPGLAVALTLVLVAALLAVATPSARAEHNGRLQLIGAGANGDAVLGQRPPPLPDSRFRVNARWRINDGPDAFFSDPDSDLQYVSVFLHYDDVGFQFVADIFPEQWPTTGGVVSQGFMDEWFFGAPLADRPDNDYPFPPGPATLFLDPCMGATASSCTYPHQGQFSFPVTVLPQDPPIVGFQPQFTRTVQVQIGEPILFEFFTINDDVPPPGVFAAPGAFPGTTEKDLPGMNQHTLGKDVTGDLNGDGSTGDMSCWPTAAWSSLSWLGDNVDDKLNFLEDAGATDEEIVEDLGSRAETDQRGYTNPFLGTQKLREFIAEAEASDSFDVNETNRNPSGPAPIDLGTVETWFQQRSDVLLNVYFQDAPGGHCAALENITRKEDGSATLEVMDPETGQDATIEVDEDGNGMYAGRPVIIGHATAITPKQTPGETKLGDATETTNGAQSQFVPLQQGETTRTFEYEWDTTGVEPGTYVIRAETTGTVFGTFNDYRVVEVVGGDPGSISGTVTGGNGGGPLDGACVAAYPVAADLDTPAAGGAITGADGTYAIDGLDPGDYIVEFNGCPEALAGYSSEWFDNQSDMRAADEVMVADGQDTGGVDAELDPAGTGSGSISGTVTAEEDGSPLADICVDVFPPDMSGLAGFTVTEVDGTFSVGVAPDEDYLVRYTDCSEDPVRIGEWFADAATSGEATPVSPPPDGAVTADAALELGGAISGTVTAAHTGEELAGICVEAFETGRDNSTLGVFSGLSVDGDGDYVIGGVPAGNYQVAYNVCDQFAQEDVNPWFSSAWFDGADSQAQSTTVAVTAGGPTVGVDGALAPINDLSVACPPGEVPAAGFPDVDEGNVHGRAIDCMAWDEYQIARGRTDGTYGPSRPVTRGQMAAFIARTLAAAGIDLPASPPNAFGDDNGHTFETEINQLADAQIVSGKSAGVYDPDGFVTRGQMAKFLVNAYIYATGMQLLQGDNAFGDDNGTTHEDNINRAATAGFTTGKTASTYDPNGLVRRDQMASFLARLLDRLLKDLTVS